MLSFEKFVENACHGKHVYALQLLLQETSSSLSAVSHNLFTVLQPPSVLNKLLLAGCFQFLPESQHPWLPAFMLPTDLGESE